MTRAGLSAIGTRTFASLRKYRNFRLYFTGQIVAQVGATMQDAALPWYILERTHSAVHVGALLFVRLAPFTLFGLFAGVVADRMDYRRCTMVCRAASFAVTAVLAVRVIFGAPAIWEIYLLALLTGFAVLFDTPASQSLLYQLVRREDVSNAMALNSTMANAARVVGPAFGGVLIGLVGAGWCFGVNAVTFLVVLAMLMAIRPKDLYPIERGDTKPTLFRGVGEAVGVVRRSIPLQVVIGLVLATSLLGFNHRVMIPIFANDGLHVGPEVFGVLYSCYGAGAIVGALFSASLGRASWRALLIGSGAVGALMFPIAWTTSVPLASALLLLTGVCMALYGPNMFSIVALASPDRFRGRMMGFVMFGLFGLQPVGGLLLAWLADIRSVALAFVVAGAVPVVTSIACALRLRGRDRSFHYQPADGPGPAA